MPFQIMYKCTYICNGVLAILYPISFTSLNWYIHVLEMFVYHFNTTIRTICKNTTPQIMFIPRVTTPLTLKKSKKAPHVRKNVIAWRLYDSLIMVYSGVLFIRYCTI